MIKQDLSIAVDGSQMPAYLARPEEGSGQHPAVIVLQEIFGVNNEVKRITDLVASAGYVGIAINYYHRTHPDLNEPYNSDGLKNGFVAAGQVSRTTLRNDVTATIEWLNQQNFVKRGKVATWGFCFGGTVAFVTATLPELSGAVCFYGASIASELPNGEPEGLADIAQISCPLLLCFGGKDASITHEQVDRITAELKAAGTNARVQVYPEVGHAFFRHGSSAALTDHKGTSDEAIAEAVADSWNVVQSFFKRVLH
ncbi:MAG TPA: dienelactone hydrolase family protein [Candidatus Baltobacteraceae bacterium]